MSVSHDRGGGASPRQPHLAVRHLARHAAELQVVRGDRVAALGDGLGEAVDAVDGVDLLLEVVQPGEAAGAVGVGALGVGEGGFGVGVGALGVGAVVARVLAGEAAEFQGRVGDEAGGHDAQEAAEGGEARRDLAHGGFDYREDVDGGGECCPAGQLR